MFGLGTKISQLSNIMARPFVMEDFLASYDELYHKIESNPNQSENIKRLKLIHHDLSSLNENIENFIDDLDRENPVLNKIDQQRIEDRVIIERATDRIKPIMLMSLLFLKL